MQQKPNHNADNTLTRPQTSRYLLLFEQASDAIMLTDFNGNLIDANESACRMFGYTKTEILNLHISSLIDAEELMMKPINFKGLKEGIHVFSERKMVHRDGTIIFVEANVKKCDDDTVMAIARNVTERKLAKDALQKEKELSDSIINTLPGLFFLREVPGKVIRWNKNTEDVLGFTSDEMRKMPLLGIIAEEDKSHVAMKVQEAIETGAAETEALVVKKNGEKVPYYFSAKYILFEDVPCILGSAIDISGRVQAEKMLEEEKQKRQQQVTEAVITGIENERQAIGRELHDNINQLLAGSLMYNRLYQDTQCNKDPLLEESATQVINAISEIRILSHSMISPFLQEQSLQEALDKLGDLLKTSGVQTISFDLTKFDETQLPSKLKITLFRIIQEQFNNILKHADAKNVMVTLKHDRKRLTLVIKDDGAGFDTSQKYEGIGLLNIKTRASLFHGVIKITSIPGKGCELKILFN